MTDDRDRDVIDKAIAALEHARSALIALRGGVPVELAGDDAWPPADIVITGPDWTSVKGAVHESGWSETTIRKYRRIIGVYRFGQWYINRPRLALLLPKPRITSQ
ncbi:hypothetical protein [Aminobacter sp. AP02]|uniref:hypothetical protein n=1 Tax=Aminobacter sp. AP02 TaxID=2135737 RepID=UPI000D6CB5A3|nr:hypothetical protein [Aminobacter sp. AP02]PWK66938.1 hypothetical protein C8K44_11354 [Aminobacter sp. AP02]